MALENEKIDTGLNAALDFNKKDLTKDSALEYGYDREEKTWQIIVKHNGDVSEISRQFSDTKVVELLNQFAIITTRAEWIPAIAALPQIQYVEKPKRIYFNLQKGRSVSCVNGIQNPALSYEGGMSEKKNLTGQGVLIGIVDSGIDYFHPTFQNEEGESRILYLWDQSEKTVLGREPIGYGYGAQYTKAEIDQALKGGEDSLGRELVPVTDRGSGHGTAVASVAAGNGNGSVGNQYRGMAPKSQLIVVKLGRSDQDFAGTTEVMEGIDYVMEKAMELEMPVVINLSFGNNNGAHDGESLFENYITQLNGVWKNSIVVASGNEGDARHHSRIVLKEETKRVPFAIGPREKNVSLQIWKQYVDEFSILVESPQGQRVPIGSFVQEASSYEMGDTLLYVYYGSPTPYSLAQEIYLEWVPVREGGELQSGTWNIEFIPENISHGQVDLWLPTVEAIGLSTGFLEPDPNTTLTIPSTARNIITVGAYNSTTEITGIFSGRGNTTDQRPMPTLVAPGVNVIAAVPGGRYGAKTGTSIAAPFVTGGVALLMEWGIVQGNDPYLYGEKVKAYLMKGARKLSGQKQVPDVTAGWGALCVENSIP